MFVVYIIINQNTFGSITAIIGAKKRRLRKNRMRLLLPWKDSNPHRRNQNPTCYHYTTRQGVMSFWRCKGTHFFRTDKCFSAIFRKKRAYRSKKEPPAINRCITHLLPEANLAHFLKRIYIISFPRRLSARIGQAPCCILLSKIPALSALACSARRTYKASFLIYQSLIAAVRAS